MKTEIIQLSKSGKCAYCVQWQTPIMAAPAFWYFETEYGAQCAVDRLMKQKRCPCGRYSLDTARKEDHICIDVMEGLGTAS